jgi:hypothetical protein
VTVAGTFHTVILAGLLTATVWFCVRGRSRPSWSRVVLAIVGAVVYAALVLLFSLHMCGLGAPFAQWALPAACLAASTMLIGTRSVRRRLTFVNAVAGLVLSLHYTGVVHGPTYVGVSNPNAMYEIAATERAWHTWLTGLYLRR